MLWTVRDAYENSCDKAIVVSSDGDYASLVQFLQKKNRICVVLSPNNKCSILLKRTNVPISYLQDQRKLFEYK